jgi:hypothetical protein
MDEEGMPVVLVLFDCPFYFAFPKSLLGSTESMQTFLNSWRSEEGEAWLESVGPVMKQRELRNIERFKSSRAAGV